MINYTSIHQHKITIGNTYEGHVNDLIWADLLNSSDEEKTLIEKMFRVELFTSEESEEIETSSKYIETIDEIGINLNFIKFIKGEYEIEPISFIIKENKLITQRDLQFKSFQDIYKKINPSIVKDGIDIFLLLLETRIDYDADLIEHITDRITKISKEIHKNEGLDRDVLLKITSLQETTIMIRENIIEKQRVLSSILKSKIFPKEDLETIRIMLKDVSSLLDHTSFNFERLEFLQNTFLGLVDMEQNRIIKLFTVVTVVFMPPTLIASMYGMNFKFMPELTQKWGYPLAISLMLISSLGTLLIFKKKRWI